LGRAGSIKLRPARSVNSTLRPPHEKLGVQIFRGRTVTGCKLVNMRRCRRRETAAWFQTTRNNLQLPKIDHINSRQHHNGASAIYFRRSAGNPLFNAPVPPTYFTALRPILSKQLRTTIALCSLWVWRATSSARVMPLCVRGFH